MLPKQKNSTPREIKGNLGSESENKQKHSRETKNLFTNEAPCAQENFLLPSLLSIWQQQQKHVTKNVKMSLKRKQFSSREKYWGRFLLKVSTTNKMWRLSKKSFSTHQASTHRWNNIIVQGRGRKQVQVCLYSWDLSLKLLFVLSFRPFVGSSSERSVLFFVEMKLKAMHNN